ncbi:MAG TPA: hypothetical protein VGR53_03175 [Nitrososphaerales archaeon]|nr:hypothetical protein [Nitrososphaerales archaeon]
MQISSPATSEVRPRIAKSSTQGLAFLALLSFVVGFSAARIFATVYPSVVVQSSGIHFHHFWYGLLMLVVAGWLGIASNRPEHDRAYAVIFGLGLGLVGDETGLLLTFGDYRSELTYVVFVVGLGVAIMLFLAVRYWEQLKDELLRVGYGERAVYLGIGIGALSALPLAFDLQTVGLVVLLLGVFVSLAGVWLHRRRRDHLDIG